MTWQGTRVEVGKKNETEDEIVARLERVLDVLIRVSDRWHAIDFCIGGLEFYDTGPVTLTALRRPLPLLVPPPTKDIGLAHFPFCDGT